MPSPASTVASVRKYRSADAGHRLSSATAIHWVPARSEVIGCPRVNGAGCLRSARRDADPHRSARARPTDAVVDSVERDGLADQFGERTRAPAIDDLVGRPGEVLGSVVVHTTDAEQVSHDVFRIERHRLRGEDAAHLTEHGRPGEFSA